MPPGEACFDLWDPGTGVVVAGRYFHQDLAFNVLVLLDLPVMTVGLGVEQFLSLVGVRFSRVAGSHFLASVWLMFGTIQWWLLGILLTSWLFNYFLGEELLFRGVLLPKMQGTFGRWDWVANAVLFGLYHLHMPWSLPSNILVNLAYTWPARRFRSNWMAVIVHGVEGLIVLPIVLMVILGLGA